MKVNQLKAGIVLSYISLFLGNIISIIYTPIMLRLLGQNEYGLYQLVASVISYLGLLSFGFSSAYIRYYSKYKVKGEDNNIAKLNGIYLIVFTVISIISIICGGILIKNIDILFGVKLSSTEIETARKLMILLIFNIALSFPFSIFNSFITANEQYLFQRVVQMVKIILNPFLVLPVLLMGYKSIGLVVMTVTLNILIEIFNAIYCWKKLKIKFIFKGIEILLFKQILIFSSFIFIDMIVDQINWNIDKVLLGSYSGTAAVAVYGIATQLNSYYMSFSTTISTVFIPRVNQLIAKDASNEELTDIFVKVGRIQFMCISLILLGIVYLGKPFILFWAGEEYLSAFPILLLLIIPVSIPLIQNVGIAIQRGKNLHKFRSCVYLGIAIINVLLSIVLCKQYGRIGCAIGTAVSLLVGNGIIMNIYYHKKCGINIKYFWAQIANLSRALIIPIIIVILGSNVLDIYNFFEFIIGGVIYTVSFCISMWMIGMNKYEKELILGPLNNIKKRLQR